MARKQESRSRKKTRSEQDAASLYFNWLKEVDQTAPTLPRAGEWLEYSVFMLARYPSLRPKLPSRSQSGVGSTLHRRRRLKSCRERFEQQLSKWERRLLEVDQSGPRVLADLKPRQRRQLAALVIDTIADLEMYPGHQKELKQLTRLAKEGARLSMLNKKIDTARKALEELRSYSSKLDPLLGGDSKWAAKRALEVLDTIVHRHTSESLRDLRRELVESESSHPCPDDPTSFGMVQLYWFFRHECGLTGKESEVRTALIRNAFWTEWAKPTKVTLQYFDAESKGSATVRQAVANYSPDRGKTP